MSNLIPIEKTELDKYNSTLQTLQARVDELEIVAQYPKSEKEWLLNTSNYEKRSITYHSESSTLPWIVLIVGLFVALSVFKGWIIL